MCRFPDQKLPIILLSALTLAGCGGEAEVASEPQAPLAIASIFPVGDLARFLAGDAARVGVLLPPGAPPHTYEVTPRQFREVQGAGLFLMVGGGLDEWAAEIPEAAGESVKIVRLSDGVPLLAEDDEEEGSGNPHIWLDPILVRDAVLPRMEAALVELAPEGAPGIRERRRALADSLTALDAEIRAALAPLARRSFVATHASWSYYARRYGLDEVGVIHTHQGMDPSSRELAQLLEASRGKEIHCVFIEPQIGELAARAVATELDIPSCMLDPLGGPAVEGRDGYMALLRFNTQQFVRGLGAGRP